MIQEARDHISVDVYELHGCIARASCRTCLGQHARLAGSQRTVAGGSGTAKAIEHALKRWPALQRYASSGSLPIDNNPVENAIRPVAIGKKNWLFAGSERAGRRAAAIQSLFATAKLNGLDPARWLADTLEQLLTCPISRIDSLLVRKLYPALSSNGRWGGWTLTIRQRRSFGPLK